MRVYYNENDRHKAAWLRELIKEGVIADGIVDERSIKEVEPADLTGFGQCHFFAGIGVWSYALRLAGIADDRPVWTGSCPCPSFSAAGKGKGFDDPRHLWPDWFQLICQRKPATIFGEQVDDAIGHGWLDLVQTDLEGQDYAVGKAVLGAHSVGAPHIRQRLYFGAVANADIGRQSMHGSASGESGHDECGSEDGIVDVSIGSRLEGHAGNGNGAHQSGRLDQRAERPTAETGAHGELADADGGLSGDGDLQRSWEYGQWPKNRRTSFWSDIEWIPCTDGKARPTQPGLFPLAHGTPNRVLKLRGLGDAIVAPLAAEFIQAFEEVTNVLHTYQR